MQTLRALLLVLIAATFAVGGTARAMPVAHAAEPPCHEAPTSPEKSRPAAMAMNCCVGCMPAPTETPIALTAHAAEPAIYVVAEPAGDGLTRAPDPDPPRLRA